MKKALVLAGGIPQAELIKNLKNRGIFTILADMNPEAYAVKFADKFITVSALDHDAVKKAAIWMRYLSLCEIRQRIVYPAFCWDRCGQHDRAG